MFLKKGDVSAAEIVGFSGDCIFKTEIDPTGTYDDKTVISKFLKYSGTESNKKTKNNDPFFDDDIPFG